MRKPFLTRQDVIIISTFINILQKNGKKQRAINYVFNLFNKLKQNAKVPKSSKYQIHKLDDNNPIQLIQKCVNNLKPAFILRRIMRAGKVYELPVPITEKRAMFMAFNWIRKTVLNQKKSYTSFTSLLTNEVTSLVFNEGSAKLYLKDYIDTAMDQKPFERYIKKRRIVKVRSRETKPAKKFRRIFKRIMKRRRMRWFKNQRILKLFRKHDFRSRLAKSRKKRNKINLKKRHKKSFKT